jgi:hypothetical protein
MTNATGNRIPIEQAALEIWRNKFPQAKCILLAGSVVRGESTAFSDLDLVVLFDHVPHAWRESFIWSNWPVEAFCHDYDTAKYFTATELKTGWSALPNMIAEGMVVPDSATAFAEPLKNYARQILQAGPAELTAADLDRKRYEPHRRSRRHSRSAIELRTHRVRSQTLRKSGELLPVNKW